MQLLTNLLLTYDSSTLALPVQVIRCQQLAASHAYLREWLSTFHPEAQQAPVHRCTAILDGPVVPGEQQTLLVFPPGQLPSAEEHAVRGLALCSSTKACPEGRWVGGW